MPDCKTLLIEQYGLTDKEAKEIVKALEAVKARGGERVSISVKRAARQQKDELTAVAAKEKQQAHLLKVGDPMSWRLW